MEPTYHIFFAVIGLVVIYAKFYQSSLVFVFQRNILQYTTIFFYIIRFLFLFLFRCPVLKQSKTKIPVRPLPNPIVPPMLKFKYIRALQLYSIVLPPIIPLIPVLFYGRPVYGRPNFCVHLSFEINITAITSHIPYNGIINAIQILIKRVMLS